MSLVHLTAGQTEKIQIDEGIVVINLGEAGEEVLGPCRGGAELKATPSIRDIEYDGKKGKTNLQVKDSEDVSLIVKTLNCSQEMLKLAIPNSSVSNDTGKKIEQGDFGLITLSNYLPNVSIITRTLDNKFKILKIKNAMHEGEFNFKAVPKAENEHNLEFIAHYDYTNDNKIWEVYESATNPIAE